MKAGYADGPSTSTIYVGPKAILIDSLSKWLTLPLHFQWWCLYIKPLISSWQSFNISIYKFLKKYLQYCCPQTNYSIYLSTFHKILYSMWILFDTPWPLPFKNTKRTLLKWTCRFNFKLINFLCLLDQLIKPLRDSQSWPSFKLLIQNTPHILLNKEFKGWKS